jgi:glutamate/tyrosine decarboxylase-like PLP-dependent enzyme
MAQRHGVWLHVDAAYGGPAILSAQYGDALRPIAAADSIALDPHKWLFVPVEAGLVMVRDAAAMRAAFSLVPPYLRTDGKAGGVGGPTWFSEYGFQQTRGFRALKVWMTLQQFGLNGVKAAIEENIALARHLADQIRAADDFELAAPPGLSVVCFRYVGGGPADENTVDTVNRALLERLQLGGDAFITSTELHGRFVLRACIVNYRTTRADVDRMLAAIRTLGQQATGEASG